jgi:hypothetical protein
MDVTDGKEGKDEETNSNISFRTEKEKKRKK